MKILFENKLIDYENNLCNDSGKISLEKGQKIEIKEDVCYIVPGFIDQHIHGLLGYDTMDGTDESLFEQSKGLILEGTTSFLPTTMTASINKINEVLDVIKGCIGQEEGAEIIGVHLEGPFINIEKVGAQNPENIQELSVDSLKKLNNLDIVKIITYAPEKDKGYEFTKFLKEKGIIASVGHSNASCKQVIEAQKNGLNSFTHLHNGCSGYDHRQAGVVTAAYLLDDPHKEMIVDGIHLDEYTIKSVYKNIGADKINLITDAMRAKSQPDGIYDLGGLLVEKKGDKAVLKEGGALAGSVLKMNVAVRNMIKLSGCSPEEAFKMASFNQAQMLGLKNKGLIAQGYDFDIVGLNKDFEVVQVFKKGKQVL